MTPLTMHMTEVTVPDLGDVKDAPVIDVLARVGASVRVDETVVTLETEKATMDVPSTVSGTIREVRVKEGDSVRQGSILIVVEIAPQAEIAIPPSAETHFATPSTNGFVPASAAPRSAPIAPEARRADEPLSPSPTVLPHASPSVRRFARELGVDLLRVQGSGPKGRIVPEDVQAFVKETLTRASPPTPARAAIEALPGTAALPLLPWPQIDFSKFGPVERVGLSKVRKISGANLARNSILIPHVTNFDEADITETEAFRVDVNGDGRDKAGKLTMLAFLIKASVAALKAHPNFNASLDGDELILKGYYHVGFAADTPGGLMVPVIKDADKKGLQAIAAEAAELAAQARAGKLPPGDMQGGCFTISSLGGIGGTGFTPIINAPEVAILGSARARMAPVWNGVEFRPRLMLPLSLSWDHRVVDGAAAARFLVTLSSLLRDFRRVLL